MVNTYCYNRLHISIGITNDIDLFVFYESQEDATFLKDIVLSTCNCQESDYSLYFFRNKVEFILNCNYLFLNLL